MRKPLIIATATAVALLAGCQAKSASPTATKEEAQAQALIQSCATKANFLTKPGRTAFLRCVAPPGESAQVQTCAQGFIAKDGLLTKAQRRKFEADLATCIVPPKTGTVATKKGHK